MIILIRNLDRATTHIQLHSLLRGVGKVNSLDLVMDEKTGQSKGFAFADMPPNDAMKAIQSLNNAKVGNAVIRVKKAAASSVQKGKARGEE